MKIFQDLHKFRLFAKSKGRNASWLVQAVEKGQVPLEEGGRVCVFVHFDSQGLVDKYVQYYVRELHKNGFSIIFITCGGRWNPDHRDWVSMKPLVSYIIRRKNIGHDFFGYKIGIEFLGNLARFSEILLVNDSVYGPLFDLSRILQNARESDAEFWGLTDSHDIHWHMQSYFLGFKGKALKSGIVRKFFENYKLRKRKDDIIWHGELKLSRILHRAGYKILSVVPNLELLNWAYRNSRLVSISSRSVINGNPSHFYWNVLIENFKLPFIKRDLLLNEKSRFHQLADWRQVIRSNTTYPLHLIEDHLDRWKRRIS